MHSALFTSNCVGLVHTNAFTRIMCVCVSVCLCVCVSVCDVLGIVGICSFWGFYVYLLYVGYDIVKDGVITASLKWRSIKLKAFIIIIIIITVRPLSGQAELDGDWKDTLFIVGVKWVRRRGRDFTGYSSPLLNVVLSLLKNDIAATKRRMYWTCVNTARRRSARKLINPWPTH